MASPRLSMHKTREILRQKWCLSRSHREVARSQGVSAGMVGATLRRARTAGLEARPSEPNRLASPPKDPWSISSCSFNLFD